MAVFCPCREPDLLAPDKLPTLLGRDECYFSLNALLFCPTCRSVRCPFCADSEPVAWFCAACLMETTKQGARAAGNRCMRNCLRCPRCTANVVLKPAGTDRLGAACAAPACGWVYAGTFDKPAKQGPALSVAQQVRVQQERPLHAVLDVVKARFPDKRPGEKLGEKLGHAQRLPAEPLPSDPIGTEPISTERLPVELPLLVPLRAKTRKKCRVCETCLVDPSRKAGVAEFAVSSVARQFLPSAEAYRVGAEIKVVLRSRAPAAMAVRVASPDADTAVLTPRVVIPAPDAAGFVAPLFLVERETTASRQAFMAGADQARGRGWAVCGIEQPADRDHVRLFTSSSVGDEQPLGAWIKVPIVERQ